MTELVGKAKVGRFNHHICGQGNIERRQTRCIEQADIGRADKQNLGGRQAGHPTRGRGFA